MHVDQSAIDSRAARRWPSPRLALAELLALALAGAVGVATVGSDHWRLWPLVVIAVFTVVSDLTSVETGSTKLKISGSFLGIVLAAVLLGGGPAALVGVL